MINYYLFMLNKPDYEIQMNSKKPVYFSLLLRVFYSFLAITVYISFSCYLCY